MDHLVIHPLLLFRSFRIIRYKSAKILLISNYYHLTRSALSALAKAIDSALEDGLTVNEVKEALSQLYAYTGFPRSLNALVVLQNVVKEREEAGKTSVEGQDADPLPEDYDALKQGSDVQTQMRGGTPLNYAFAPATDYYLKAHLFGDIFARNNLTFADRELVTVSALSGLDGVDSQLKVHVGGAVNMGLSETEVRSIPVVLADKVGEKEAYRVRKAIAAAFGDEFNELPPLTFETGEPNTAFAKYFIGNSYRASLLRVNRMA